jgi:hypothetical protein
VYITSSIAAYLLICNDSLSLSLASHLLAAGVTAFLILVFLPIAVAVLASSTTSVVSVPISLLELLQLASLSHILWLGLSLTLLAFSLRSSSCTLKGVSEKFGGFGIDCVGELDFELNDQVTVLIGSLVEGHAKLLNGELRLWLDNLSRSISDADLSSIKVSQHEI